MAISRLDVEVSGGIWGLPQGKARPTPRPEGSSNRALRSGRDKAVEFIERLLGMNWWPYAFWAYVAIDQLLEWRIRYYKRIGRKLTTRLMHLRFDAWQMDFELDGFYR